MHSIRACFEACVAQVCPNFDCSLTTKYLTKHHKKVKKNFNFFFNVKSMLHCAFSLNYIKINKKAKCNRGYGTL